MLLPHPLLAVGSYDGNVRLLSTRSWAVAFVLPACHPSEMPSILNHGISPTVEVAGDADEASNDVFSFSRNSSRYSYPVASLGMSLSFHSRLAARSFVPEDKFGNAYVTKPMKSLPHVTADPHGKGGLKLGVHWVGWSGDGQMLAVRAEDYPRCIWIWNGIEGQLASLLVQMSAVTCARWRPSQPDRPHLKPMLAFCTGVARVYFWTPAGTSWVDIPDNSNKADEEVGHKNIIVGAAGSESTKLLVTHLKWSSDGRKLMLIGKGSLCNCDISSDDIMMGDSA